MLEYTFHWRPVLKCWPELLSGGFLTLQITVISMIVGLVIAMALCVFKESQNKTTRYIAGTWVAIARNTPALLQIYMVYFGLGSFGIHVNPYFSVLLALIFNNAGYLTEILRGGIDAISPAQQSSALGLGMNSYQVYVYVIFPQILQIVFLPIMNQVIWAMINSSLGMIVGLQELTGMTTFLQSQTFRPFEFYSAAALMYLVIVKLISLAAKFYAGKRFKWKTV